MDTTMQQHLYAGAAEVDITPAMDIQLSGDIGRRRPVQEIRERLYAKALVLTAGDTRCCILSVEVCVFQRNWVDEIRRRAAERFGFDPKSVMVHALQIHSAPSLGNATVSDDYQDIAEDLWWVRSGDERYNEPAVSGILDAIGLALARLEPVTAHLGREFEGSIAIKLRSPFPHTFVAHAANGYGGYIPTAEAIRRSGSRSFETKTSNWSKLIPEALEMIADKAVAMLERSK